MQPVHRIGKGGLLVVHRHHHVENWNPGSTRYQRGVGSRFELDPMTPAVEGDVCHDAHGCGAACVPSGVKLCPGYEFFGGEVRS